MGNKSKSRRMGKLHLMTRHTLVEIPCSQGEVSVPAVKDPRADFYKIYRKEAEEYDKEFIKKYDEDLNTTLIFVSLVCYSNAHVLTWAEGWSVLRRDFSLHHRRQLPTPTRSE